MPTNELTNHLCEAMRLRHDHRVSRLLAAGADPDHATGTGRRPLHGARNAQQTRVLLQAGADPNARDSTAVGATPLHNARSPDQVLALLEAGADLEARDKYGRTPMETVYVAAVRTVIEKALAQKACAQAAHVNPQPQDEGQHRRGSRSGGGNEQDAPSL